jgi:hypothetical protein
MVRRTSKTLSPDVIFYDPNMSKSDALNLVLWASGVLCFCGSAIHHEENRYSMRQTTAQQTYAGQKISQTSVFQLISLGQAIFQQSDDLIPGTPDMAYAAQVDFSQRLQGGVLLRFEFGLIVVKPTAPAESLQPTALTTDAIITSSVRSKITSQSHLPPGNFQIQTDDGIVTIHAKGESLDQAAEMINLALGVPDIRQIVYTMQSSV